MLWRISSKSEKVDANIWLSGCIQGLSVGEENRLLVMQSIGMCVRVRAAVASSLSLNYWSFQMSNQFNLYLQAKRIYLL